ncbi:MAG: hypothetical protein PUP46_10490 [Endozoicomonas sp. (ex Botrylloides leachii)]|nr:hypothetical protein [Endozoicomonas sp. (ex Botrylloides leachii)]
MTAKQTFINEIAEKNKILLDHDDPLLTIFTSNDLLSKDLAKQVQKSYENASKLFDKSIKETSAQWQDETQKSAEKIIEKTLELSRKAMAQEFKKGEEKLQTIMREQIGSLIAERDRFVQSKRETRSYTIPVLVFGFGLLFGAIAEYIAFKGIPFI